MVAVSVDSVLVPLVSLLASPATPNLMGSGNWSSIQAVTPQEFPIFVRNAVSAIIICLTAHSAGQCSAGLTYSV